MVKKEIYIHIEGADRSDAEPRMRKGFSKFLEELYQIAREKGFDLRPPQMRGSREKAYKEFKLALKQNKDAIHFLLVDSDGPVAKNSPWQHLEWDPVSLDDSHCHLMAQTMEAWLIADKTALADFYKQGFNQNALPQNPRVEEIPKTDLFDGLNRATEKTSKGRYHKTIHGPEILKRLDVAKVRKAAPHCERLFKTLTEKMTEL